MAKMSMIQSLNSAMDNMMERDPNVLVFGEDAGYFGGVFRVTAGLQDKYGLDRCFDAPINEAAIMAMSIGMARFSSPITSSRASTRSSRKCRVCAIGRPVNSRPRWWYARRVAGGSEGGRRTL
jgi:hypothetical protein